MKKVYTLVLVASLAALAAASVADAGQIYFIDGSWSSPRVSRANTDGTGLQSTALASASLPQALDFDVTGARLFSSELAFAGAHLNHGSVNLGGVSPVESGLSSLRGVAVDAVSGKVYWSSTNLVTGPLVQRANLDGSSAQVLLSLPPAAGSSPRGLAIDAAHAMLYLADFDGGRIQKLPLAGGPTTSVLTGLNGPSGIAIDPAAGRMYWTEMNAGSIHSANLDGSSPATLVTGLSSPNYIALDMQAGRMYWTEIGTPAIGAADLTGTGAGHLPLTVVQPEGIAFLPVNTTPVLFASLEVEAGQGYVDVRWSAFTEAGSAFQVFRAPRADGPFTAVSPEISGAGDSQSTYRDRTAAPGSEYFYKVGSRTGASWAYSGVSRVATPAAVFALHRAYPNPARGSAHIAYELPTAGQVRLEVYDLSGRLVRTLVDSWTAAGPGSVQWDGRTSAGQAVASGVYFARLAAGGRTANQRIMMLP